MLFIYEFIPLDDAPTYGVGHAITGASFDASSKQ